MTLDIGRVGIWSVELRTAAPDEIADAAAELDELSFGALWIPGLGGGDIVGDLERLLEVTRGLTVAPAVSSIWRHPAKELAAGHARLTGTYGDRVLLGLGVSDPGTAAEHGHEYRPLHDMAAYLDELDAEPDPVAAERLILAAMGPKMVGLARRRAGGTHPFLVTADYSATARELLGTGPLLAPYLAVTLERDPAKARAAGRGFLAWFFGAPAYRKSLLAQGFTEADLAEGGSDRLVDSVLAWGDIDAIGKRVEEHLQAGADHVALHVVGGGDGMPMPQWRELAGLAQSAG
ncbi:TIGR03620 family F420-dependent LLM class oxidoreductase [Amycolatopsis sp. NPDC051372]|uniref:TIGR03620 family F420-dependent LLM class oxidoreductase n=1 Tax=unclassified Amycolatopsis TaxID=2618356 RepID=UPI003448CF21